MDPQRPDRPIWLSADGQRVCVIDQRRLPHRLRVIELSTVDGVIAAIDQLVVRGAPLIGVTGAYGVMLAAQQADDETALAAEAERIRRARPTAVNLAWAVDQTLAAARGHKSRADRVEAARNKADGIAQQEVERCRAIGEHGARLLAEVAARKNGPVQVLTHCNAGWLACVAYGTATAPIYVARQMGIDVHVWVDETRPLNQGARLTAWELAQAGVPCTVVCDNAGGHLMQHGMVDLVIVGTDRTTRSGDVANKIGTYLKALAARDCGVPFYVALPSSTFDWTVDDGLAGIVIEERDADEVHTVWGSDGSRPVRVRITPPGAAAFNPAFDVTPARLVTGLITERGVCAATAEAIAALFPEQAGGRP